MIARVVFGRKLRDKKRRKQECSRPSLKEEFRGLLLVVVLSGPAKFILKL